MKKSFLLLTKIFSLILLMFGSLVFAQEKTTKTIIIPNPKPSPKIKPAVTKTENVYTLTAGTVLRAKMDSEINSKNANTDDTFTATLIGSYSNRGVEILPENTVIEGRIVKAVKAGRKGEPGRLKVIFEKIKLPNGTTRDIVGELSAIIERKAELNNESQQVKGNSTKTENTAIIAGGAGIGAVIGGIAGGTDGALIGAAIGAGAGTGTVLVKKGNEAIVKANSELSILLKEDVVMPTKEY